MRGDAGRDRGGRDDVERPADAVQRVGDVGRRVGPAEPQAGQPVDLREGARHDDVLVLGDQFEAGRIVVAAHILGIGRVEDEQHVVRQAGVQAPAPRRRADRCRSDCSGWRGRRSSSSASPRARMRVDVGRVVRLRRHDRRPRRRLDGDPVDEEAVLGEYALVARPDIGLGEEVQQLVRAGAADDAALDRALAAGRSPRAARSRCRPGRRRACCACRGVGGERLRARAQRRLVRGELVDLGAARRGALAGHIGLDVEDAGRGVGRSGALIG